MQAEVMGRQGRSVRKRLADHVQTLAKHRQQLAADWGQSTLQAVANDFQQLARTASDFNLERLQPRARQLATVLVSESTLDLPPDTQQAVLEQISRMEAFLGALITPQQQAARANAAPRSAGSKAADIVICGDLQGASTPGLVAALTHAELKVSVLSMPDLEALLANQHPKVVMVDAARLRRLASVLEPIRKASLSRLACVVVDAQGSAEAKLDALRHGADLYLRAEQPVDQIADRLSELVADVAAKASRVMIVDDDRQQALFCAAVLRRRGMLTQHYTDAREALAVLDEFRPDLVLVDLYMPEIDGLEFTSLLRDQLRFNQLPIVFLTGEHDPERRIDALSLGGDDYLTKPISPRHLAAVVEGRIRRIRDLTKTLAASVATEHRVQTVDDVVAALETAQTADKAASAVVLAITQRAHLAVELGASALASFDQQASALIHGCLPERSVLARLKDFVYAASMQGNRETVAAACKRVRRAFENEVFETSQCSISSTIDIGVSEVRDQDKGATILDAAYDEACRTNTLKRVTGSAPKGARRDMIVDVLREGLDDDVSDLEFSPLARVRGNLNDQYFGELTVKLPDGSIAGPDEFYLVARALERENALDCSLISRALLVRKTRLGTGRQIRLFLSVSQASLASNDLPQWLGERLRKWRLSGTGLALSFQLADVMADAAHATETFGFA